MTYDKDRGLIRAQEQNEEELFELYKVYDTTSLWQKLRHLGATAHTLNRIASLEGQIRERKKLMSDDTATDTNLTRIEDD